MSDVERPWDAPGGPDSTSPPAKKPSGCLWSFLGIAAFVIVVGLGFSSCGGSDSDDAPSAYEARMQCERWVKDKLKAPATAEFSGAVETSTGTNSWTITGNVDAENGFGAQVRSVWSCDIRLDGDTWRGTSVVS